MGAIAFVSTVALASILATISIIWDGLVEGLSVDSVSLRDFSPFTTPIRIAIIGAFEVDEATTGAIVCTRMVQPKIRSIRCISASAVTASSDVFPKLIETISTATAIDLMPSPAVSIVSQHAGDEQQQLFSSVRAFDD